MSEPERTLDSELSTGEEAPGLEADVDSFVAAIKRRYARRFAYRPRAFTRRVASLVLSRMLPEHKRPGPKQKPRISRAAELVKIQEREIRQGKRRKVNWLPIAEQCIPGFAKIRMESRRSKSIDQLRNSTRQRLKRLRRKRAVTIVSADLSR